MKKLAIYLLIFVLFACSTNNEIPPLTKAEQSVAIGAAIGGGLGAIAGSQSGSTGEGLALGAVAGAGVGALIGNELQNQDETIDQQKEHIAMQEKKLRMQESELEELRKMRMDRITYKEDKKISENDIDQTYSTISENKSDTHASYNWKQEKPTIAKFTNIECREASNEMQQAEASQATAEKLYHYRRALRLCPENPALHTGLSKVYLELDRKDDAKYELQEALKLDPEYEPARDLLKTI